MTKRKPKVIENSRGELVTQGMWITHAELERREKELAHHHQSIAAQVTLDQNNTMQGVMNRIVTAINQAIAIASCGNSPETRVYAKHVLGDVEGDDGVLEVSKRLWENRADFYMIDIIEGKYKEIMRWLEDIVLLLQVYIEEPVKADDTRTEEHAALRHYVEAEFPNVKTLMADRLMARSKRDRQLETVAAVQRVNVLLKEPGYTVQKAVEQAADEHNTTFDALYRAYYRLKSKSVTLS